jgi:hypothetical protein
VESARVNFAGTRKARSSLLKKVACPLPIKEGRTLYETYVSRRRVTGGVRKSTQKRYRAVFDKFVPFAASHSVTARSGVTAAFLSAYAAHLEGLGYAYKT